MVWKVKEGGGKRDEERGMRNEEGGGWVDGWMSG